LLSQDTKKKRRKEGREGGREQRRKEGRKEGRKGNVYSLKRQYSRRVTTTRLRQARRMWLREVKILCTVA
jgi:hypothetical protein